MAKTSYDLALLLDVLQEQGHAGYRASGFISALKDSWAELAVGVVDYKKWIFASEFLKPDDSATAQMVGQGHSSFQCRARLTRKQNKEFQAAYDSIKPRAKKFVNNVPLLPRSELEFKGRDSLFTIMRKPKPVSRRCYTIVNSPNGRLPRRLPALPECFEIQPNTEPTGADRFQHKECQG